MDMELELSNELSFLNMQLPGSHSSELCCMYVAKVFVVLFGLNHARWITYAFVDVDYYGEDSEARFEFHGRVKEDYIVSPSVNPIDAKQYIWDPREYFLMTLTIWIIRVQEKSQYLVRKIERSIKSYVLCRVPGSVP
jgi:hypothetical protein